MCSEIAGRRGLWQGLGRHLVVIVVVVVFVVVGVWQGSDHRHTPTAATATAAAGALMSRCMYEREWRGSVERGCQEGLLMYGVYVRLLMLHATMLVHYLLTETNRLDQLFIFRCDSARQQHRRGGRGRGSGGGCFGFGMQTLYHGGGVDTFMSLVDGLVKRKM